MIIKLFTHFSALLLQGVVHKVRHKYLVKRHQIFYFRWRIHKELQAALGLKEIKFSLKTASFLVAQSRANKWFDVVNHAKLIKNAYQFSEISHLEYIQSMKKKINQTQQASSSNSDSAYTTELIVYTLGGGRSLMIDYDGASKKEEKTLLAFQKNEAKQLNHTKPAGVTLSQFFEDFLAYKSELSIKMKGSYVLYMNTLVEIMGDKDIALIEQGDVMNALQDYLRLPKRNLAKYRDISVSELLEMDIDEEDKLTQKSVSQVKKLLQSIFAYAVEKKYVSSSVMNGLKMDFKSTSYGKYEDEEVLRILHAVNAQKDISRKWICWLAAYTGARRGEVIQLRKQDIRVDSKTKRRYLLITTDAGRLKTENAHRKVPIHMALIDEGFLEYVEASGSRLFEGVNAETFTKWFSEFRESLGIEKYDDFKKRRVFHSFRHTFITKSRAADNQVDKVQQVVGHEKVHFGVTDKYSEHYDLYQLLNVVDCISFNK